MMVFLQNDDVTLMIVCSGRLNWSCRTSFPGAALLCITPIVLLGTQIHKYRYTHIQIHKYVQPIHSTEFEQNCIFLIQQ